MKFGLVIFLMLFGTASIAAVPYNFQSGQSASAAQVNSNFDNLDGRVSTNATNIAESLGGLVFTSVSLSDQSGVVGTTCPAGTLIASVNCDCSSIQGVSNYGMLFGCNLAGNGGVAGCFPEGTTFNPALAMPLATVTLVCIAGVKNNGTPIVPVFFKNTVAPSTKIDPSTAKAEFENAIVKAHNRLSAYTNALQNR